MSLSATAQVAAPSISLEQRIRDYYHLPGNPAIMTDKEWQTHCAINHAHMDWLAENEREWIANGNKPVTYSSTEEYEKRNALIYGKAMLEEGVIPPPFIMQYFEVLDENASKANQE